MIAAGWRARGAIMLEYVLMGLVAILIFGVIVRQLSGDGGLFDSLLSGFSGLIERAQ